MKKEYLKLPLETILDPHLSFEAIGLWVWAMAQDHDSVFSLEYLQVFTNSTQGLIPDYLKELIDNGYCIENEYLDGENDYVFLEKKISPSLLDILTMHEISRSHIQAILMYEPEEITIAIEAVQQWAEKKKNEGEPLVDYGLALIKALINKWKPSPHYANKNPNPNTKSQCF